MTSVRPHRPASPRPSGKASMSWSVVGVVVVAGLIAIIAGGGAWLSSRTPKLDPQTLCPLEGPSRVTVLMIDTTDPLSVIQRAAVDARLRRLLGELKLNEQIAVYEIAATGDPLRPILTLCRPTKPDEQNELTGSRKQAQRTFETKFQQKVQNVLAQTLARSGSDRSPIMEAIQGAAVASFLPNGGAETKRLILVSDMLENGTGGSHYAGVPTFSNYSRTQEFARTHSDLSGVLVTVLYLRRDNAAALQTRAHKEFWAAWFDAQGASLEDIIPIEG